MSSIYEPSPNTKIVVKKTERTCLKRGKRFVSTGPGNHICPKACSGNNARQYSIVAIVGGSGQVIRGIIEKRQ